MSPAPEHNLTGLDYHAPQPSLGIEDAVDAHVHIHSVRQGEILLDVAQHYGFSELLSMTPLEQVEPMREMAGDRIEFIAIPDWHMPASELAGDWPRRVEAFRRLGSKVCKVHAAPRSLADRGWYLDSPLVETVFTTARRLGMAIMTHIGDPDGWYATKYADPRYGTRQEHLAMWKRAMDKHGGNSPWIGAHLGGNPENLPLLQSLLDSYPFLYLDLSATKWIARELSGKPREARKFVIRNQRRLIFGTDQVTSDSRGWDFLASRYWVHRHLWERSGAVASPIHDPDAASPVMLEGLNLPPDVLTRLYRDNIRELLAAVPPA